jgi:beta-phosphoglucomutase
MTLALQAIVFDFDGVIANSEPLHLQAFQQALAEDDITLTAADYYRRYLGFDDVGVFEQIGRDRGLPMHDARVAALVERKGARLQALMLDAGAVLFPGAADFIRTAAAVVPIAIASGALRHEIDEIIEPAGLAGLFPVIVASGDTPEQARRPTPIGWPSSACARTGRPLEARRAVAIEDSRWGLESAQGAGLRCVGVTTSYPAHELPAPNWWCRGSRT